MNIFEQVIEAYGSAKAVQKRFNLSAPMAVYNWRTRGIPADKLIDIHLDTGIPLEVLRDSRGDRRIAGKA